MPPADAAAAILAAIEAGKRELVLASGVDDLAVLRRSDPENLFERVSAMVRAGYAKQMAAEAGRS